MRGLRVKLVAAMTTFAVGIAINAVFPEWQRTSKPVRTEISQYSGRERNCEWKLATREFATSDLKGSGSHDFFSWLKEEISAYQARPGYAQHSLTLPLTGNHGYRVELHPITREELDSFNISLQREKLPQLKQEQCYVKVDVVLDDLLCPTWGGVIEADKPRLIYFNGSGG